MSQPRRCPTCLNIMPLARRKCPYCHRELPSGDDTRSLNVLFLQETLAGKFEIISELHRRGSSTMFLAQDLILDRKVALKTLNFESDTSQELLDLWNTNLKRCIRVEDPHIARIYTFGSTGSLNYIILEFIADNTLEDILSETTEPLPVWKCLHIGRDVAQGLHAAHLMGITHHRLTPSNIAVSRDGYSRVLDLGAAQGTIDALAKRPWSMAMDSSKYFAPEQIESGVSEPFSDQYRLGIILYHLLARSPAYKGGDETGAFKRLGTPPSRIKELNPAIPDILDDIIFKALSINPEERFGDCNEFALALESLDPDVWLPDIESHYRSTTPEVTVARILDDVNKNEKNKEYYSAFKLCEKALALAPYNAEVTNIMLRVQQKHEKIQEIRNFINKALIAFYANNLTVALRLLENGRKIDSDNAELLRLTHEVMREQERQRLISALIEAAEIDFSKQALSSAMSNVVRVLDIDPGNEAALKLKQRIEFGMEDRATLGALVERAESAYSTNRLEDAIELIEKIQGIDPANFHAKKLTDQIARLKKHRLLMDLWANLDILMRDNQYREAIATLKRIAEVDPSLKSDIRSRLVRIREKLTEQNAEELQGETRPVRKVKPSDLKSRNHSPVQPENPLEVTPLGLTVHQKENLEKTIQKIHPRSVPTLQEEQEQADLTPKSVINPNTSRDQEIEHPEEKSETDTFTNLSLEPDPQPQSLLRYLKWLIPAVCVLVVILIIAGIGGGESEQTEDSTNQKKPGLIATEPTNTPKPTPAPTSTPSAVPSPTPTKTPEPTSAPTKAPTQHPESEMIESLLKSAQYNKQNQNFEMALALYRQVLRHDRSNQKALKGMQNCQQEINQSKVISNPTHTPTPLPKKQVEMTHSDSNKPEIISIVCLPESIVPSKSLAITIRFKQTDRYSVDKLWFYYRDPDGVGFSQVYAKKQRSGFEIMIPESEILSEKLLYFLNGIDSEGKEFYFGSAREPKILP